MTDTNEESDNSGCSKLSSTKFEVTILDASGSISRKVRVPKDVLVSCWLPIFVSKAGLPDAVYALHSRTTGRTLSENETLEQAGIQSGDELVCLPSITAGGGTYTARYGSSTGETSLSADTLEELRELIKMNRDQLKLEQLKETERTRRLWLILAVVSVLVALVIITFAPEGRQTLSYWIGGALLIFAAGAAGYKRVWGKGPGISVGADQDKRDM